MIKYILLISLFLPFPALSHEWSQYKWLERILTNHVVIGDCWHALEDEDTATFQSKCSAQAMASTENSVMTTYRAAKLHHPELNDLEFIALHFPDATADQLWEIFLNVQQENGINGILIAMYLAEVFIQDDK